MFNIRSNTMLLFTVFCCLFLHAQTFKNKAAIEPVSKTGFYAISITPELSGYLKTDFRDLRILDAKGNAVPYIIKSTLSFFKSVKFSEAKIISNEILDSGKNIIVIEPDSPKKITDLFLKIKNAAVSREVDLSGSDDKKHWYSIRENIILEKRFITDTDSYVENLSFPLSSYKYYRITIYNGKNDPLNITSVGSYFLEGSQKPTAAIENPGLQFLQKDSSDHYSYVSVFNPGSFHIDGLEIHVNGPKFFKRGLRVAASNQTIAELDISSDSAFQFGFGSFKDSLFDIRIYNGDNPPLKIVSVETFQTLQKAVVYLEQNALYTVELNSDDATAPVYDLQSFKDSIPVNFPELKLAAIQKIEIPQAKKSPDFFQQWWMWPVIILVLLTLVIFTVRLLKDVERKN